MNSILDSASIWGAASALIRLLVGPLTLLLVAYKLTAAEMGFYFQFFSIYAFQQVLEGGVGFLLLRYCSKLKGSESLSDADRLRLIIKVRFSVLWYSYVSIFLLVLLSLIGVLVFSNDPLQSEVGWKLPWIVYIVFSCLNLGLYPHSILNEVFHDRGDVYKKRAIVNLLQAFIIIFCLFLNLKLYSLAIASIVVFAMNRKFYFYSGKIILGGFSIKKLRFVNELKEYFSENWKIIVVWVTGYFYWFSLPVIVFMLLGSEVSGIFSFTNATVLAVSTLASVVVVTKAAVFSDALNSGRYVFALNEFFKSNLMAIVLYFPVLPFVGFVNFEYFSFLNGKLLGGDLFFLLALNQLFVLVNSNFAFFCRLKDGDPFFFLSISSNFCTPIVLLLVGLHFENLGHLVFVSVILNLIYLLCGVILYRKFVRSITVI